MVAGGGARNVEALLVLGDLSEMLCLGPVGINGKLDGTGAWGKGAVEQAGGAVWPVGGLGQVDKRTLRAGGMIGGGGEVDDEVGGSWGDVRMHVGRR